MRWFVTVLCVISVAALPTGVSANTTSEAASAKPIVIAYIPEYLQHRVPGHQPKPHAAPVTPSERYSHKSGLSRTAKIGLGVGIPIFVLGVSLTAGAVAVALGQSTSY